MLFGLHCHVCLLDFDVLIDVIGLDVSDLDIFIVIEQLVLFDFMIC